MAVNSIPQQRPQQRFPMAEQPPATRAKSARAADVFVPATAASAKPNTHVGDSITRGRPEKSDGVAMMGLGGLVSAGVVGLAVAFSPWILLGLVLTAPFVASGFYRAFFDPDAR